MHIIVSVTSVITPDIVATQVARCPRLQKYRLPDGPVFVTFVKKLLYK